jgi:hypothetical protein
MTALCHAEFALSEADYFLGVLHSEKKADGQRRLAGGTCALVPRCWRQKVAVDALGEWAEARDRKPEGVQQS